MTQTRTSGRKAPGQNAPRENAPRENAPRENAPRQNAPDQRAATPGRPRRRLPGSVTLTGRGGVIALLAACLLGLLLTSWTGWTALADVIFVATCGLVACYTRARGLRYVVVCPPLAFLAGTVIVAFATVPGTFLALETILVTLGSSAPWLFTGTALTAAISLGRGWRPELAARARARIPRQFRSS